jgi:ABC-type lipoprotein release transport system permease subunit
MASSHEGAFPVSIVGIEPEAEAPVSMVAERVAEGRFLESGDGDLILIGRGLADAMDIHLGERLTLVGSDAHKQNRQRSMTVVGIYDLGLRTTEKKTVYISLEEAQDLYGLPGASTEVVINLRNLGEEPRVVAELAPALPGYEVESWERNYPEMQTAINTKTSVMNAFGVIILFIAGIGILNVLLMAVYERTREIGLLAAMGLKPMQISALFLLEGSLIGAVGVVAGVLLGVAVNASLGQVGLDYTQFAGVTEYMALISGRVYPTLGLSKVASRALTAVIIAILAAWIPAREAAHREPAEALHYV